MNESLLQTMTEVTDANTAKIAQLEEKTADHEKALQLMTDWKVAVERLSRSNSDVNLLNAQVAGLSRDIQSFRVELQEMKSLLSKTQQHEHRHYFPKIAWVTVGLFLALCLAITGWYNTTSHLSEYRDNDLKYRYMRLVDQTTVIQSVRKADSLQQAKPNFFRDSVLAVELDRKRRLEYWDEADRKEAEASELRKKATQ